MDSSGKTIGAQVTSIDEVGDGFFVNLRWDSNEIPSILKRRPSFTDFDFEVLGDVLKGAPLYPNEDRVFVSGSCQRKIGDRIPLRKVYLG